MGTKEKLVKRLLTCPKDFTFEEAETLLPCLGFERSSKGRTSGLRVGYLSRAHGKLMMHRPHPNNALKPYQIRQLIDVLTQKGLI